MSPYEEFQRYKTHPAIRAFFEGGKRIAYGARAITAGGLQSLPKLVFPGGVPDRRRRGLSQRLAHQGQPCRDQVRHARGRGGLRRVAGGTRASDELTSYPEAFRASWLHDELHRARNFKPWMSKGLYTGTLMVGIDQVVFRGKAPWTLHHKHADHETLKKKTEVEPIAYPKPDGVLTFDRLSSVFISNTNHEENQPAHLTLKDPSVPIKVNLALYDAPEQRYCPAGVYEIVRDDDGCQPAPADQRAELRPLQDLRHQGPDPEHRVGKCRKGGGGPNYPNM